MLTERIFRWLAERLRPHLNQVQKEVEHAAKMRRLPKRFRDYNKRHFRQTGPMTYERIAPED